MAKRKMTDWPSVADEVLLVPPEVLEGPAEAIRNPRKKTAKKRSASKRSAKSQYELDIAALAPFGDDDDLIVRTALLRPKSYNPRRKRKISSPEDVARLCRHMVDYEDEHYVVLVVDNRNALRAIYEAAKGGPAATAVNLHSILKIPLLVGGRGIITVHNHPSGDPTPSSEDIAMHLRVREALQCIGMELLDYAIVGDEGFYTYLEAKVMPWSMA